VRVLLVRFTRVRAGRGLLAKVGTLLLHEA
jgi:hypothetical protein